MEDPIVVVGMARTPIAAFQGQLSSLSAPELGAMALDSAITRAGIKAAEVETVHMGCVLSAGLGQAPARQAAIGAHIPHDRGATTINKMCGSGMQALILAHDQILAGSHKVIAAGGMESMSNAPYLLPKARAGYRMGHNKAIDHMFFDGLEDAYEKGTLMGVYAERTAKKYEFTREAQDEFAITSLRRAQKAQEKQAFKNEIVALNIAFKQGNVMINADEQPGNANLEKIPKLRPAFDKEGTVTAANSSSISDGAAALVLMRESDAKAKNLTPVAKIVAHATHANAPDWFTTAPVGAINKVLEKANWSSSQVDLYEINEAFAVVTMAAMKELNLPHTKVNIHGGACALGHPIGASGARIITTLINSLITHDLKTGIAALCIGGGEATALAVERY